MIEGFIGKALFSVQVTVHKACDLSLRLKSVLAMFSQDFVQVFENFSIATFIFTGCMVCVACRVGDAAR
jgi:hypothetical protein